MIRALALLAAIAACGKSDSAEPERKSARPPKDSRDADKLVEIRAPIEITAMAILRDTAAAIEMSKGARDPSVAAIAANVASLELVTLQVSLYWFPPEKGGEEIQTDLDLMLGANVRIVGIELPPASDTEWRGIGTSDTGLQPMSKGFGHLSRVNERSIKGGGLVRPDFAEPRSFPALLRAELATQLEAAKRNEPLMREKLSRILSKKFTSIQVVPRRVRFLAKDAGGTVIDVVTGTLTQRRTKGSPLELSLDRVAIGIKPPNVGSGSAHAGSGSAHAGSGSAHAGSGSADAGSAHAGSVGSAGVGSAHAGSQVGSGHVSSEQVRNK